MARHFHATAACERFARTQHPADGCPLEWLDCEIAADGCDREGAVQCRSCTRVCCSACSVEEARGYLCAECREDRAAFVASISCDHCGCTRSATTDGGRALGIADPVCCELETLAA